MSLGSAKVGWTTSSSPPARYARVSTDEQDLTAQRDALRTMGVSAKRIYVDHGLTGTNRDRPGLREDTNVLGHAPADRYR